ncbi:glycosyltransferase family 2 protein [Planococcus liqunii]|uniref:Glycosyltransferase family 2 protein n=1 Tax=Planococcus liqunii TaxID=3058394 RepID=A0ABT8MNG3_9BACL|nr:MULTISPECIES: glycosyltransferase family 2 protein [unclassified Planococcus (in: firmicutes)]MDN7226404.1 glycosyltransferase family 2 protein [Planococcus sp. N064]WKA50177.1 glycosyltransferase family 2 protein [Planococcus sp. N056]
MAKNFTNELVSVVIPIYNSEKFIIKSLDSVNNQDYKHIEIILVDDFSADNSKQIIENYMENNDNIVYLRLQSNSGAAVARNKALEIAKGRYIAFLDSDDIWYPEKISKQLELMTKENAGICYTAIEMINEENILIKDKRRVLEKVDYNFLLKNTMIATSSVVIDRNIVGDFKMPIIRSGQDYATWLKLMNNGTIAYGINEAFVQYRKSSNSLSKNKLKSIQQVWSIQRKYEKINTFHAFFNTMFFTINAIKKHYL